MIRLLGPTSRLCDGLSRRELLRIGGLSLGGLSLDRLLDRPSTASETSRSFGKAKNCIVLFLSGGASHHDTFDPKPDAPAEVRGEFDSTATALPGVRLTKYLPETAKLMRQIALVRSMTHTSSGHATGGYVMFTGQTYAKTESEANFMGRQEAPHIGSALAKISPGTGPMFPFILVPRRLDAGSGRRAGQWGGSLGSKYDPMQTGGDPNRDDFRLENLPLLANAPRPVLQRRLRLLDQLNQQTRYLKQSAPALALKQTRKRRSTSSARRWSAGRSTSRPPTLICGSVTAGTCSDNRSSWDAGCSTRVHGWSRSTGSGRRGRRVTPGTATARISKASATI
jgi:hypothetical protein